jgi:hypothetical protein
MYNGRKHLQGRAMTDTLPVMGRPKKVDAENARISREIMRKVRVLAVHEGMTAPDLLNAILGPIVDKRHASLIARLAREEKEHRD